MLRGPVREGRAHEPFDCGTGSNPNNAYVRILCTNVANHHPRALRHVLEGREAPSCTGMLLDATSRESHRAEGRGPGGVQNRTDPNTPRISPESPLRDAVVVPPESMALSWLKAVTPTSPSMRNCSATRTVARK